MRLTKLVPTLGILAATAAPAFAVDLADGALSIGGYVDTIFEYSRFEKNAPRRGDWDNAGTWNKEGVAAGPVYSLDLTSGALVVTPYNSSGFGRVGYAEGDYGYSANYAGAPFSLLTTVPVGSPSVGKNQSLADFSMPTAEINATYRIGKDVEARVDLQFDEAGYKQTQQAFVKWNVGSGVSVTAGKYVNWLGWESADAPGLYRVNYSLVGNNMLGQLTTGVRLGYTPVDDDQHSLDLGFHVVDSIYGDPYGVKDGDDLAFGAEITYTAKKVFMINLDLMYDVNATLKPGALDDAYSAATIMSGINVVDTNGDGSPDAPISYNYYLNSILGAGARDSVLGFDLNGQVDAIDGFLFAFDANYIDYSIANAMGLMVMANAKLPTSWPSSVTLMLSHYIPNDEDAALKAVLTSPTTFGFLEVANGEDAQESQIAVAYLTNPVGGDKLGLNFEVQYSMREDLKSSYFGPAATLKDRNDIGFFVELLAVIP